jgi:hypothetical protein
MILQSISKGVNDEIMQSPKIVNITDLTKDARFDSPDDQAAGFVAKAS